MRAVLAVAILGLAAAPTRADVSVAARRPTPLTPLGPACDAALAAAQNRFAGSEIDFHVRQRRVVGAYHWSDMCGVWGDYAVELAPDLRAPLPWQWSTRPGEYDSFHRRGTRRQNRWRARIVIDGDSDDYLGASFVAAFEPAIEVCLASASARR